MLMRKAVRVALVERVARELRERVAGSTPGFSGWADELMRAADERAEYDDDDDDEYEDEADILYTAPFGDGRE
jgi:hypothetical protein